MYGKVFKWMTMVHIYTSVGLGIKDFFLRVKVRTLTEWLFTDTSKWNGCRSIIRYVIVALLEVNVYLNLQHNTI